ncbi:unnamed protein product, partial [Rotaria sordida]
INSNIEIEPSISTWKCNNQFQHQNSGATNPVYLHKDCSGARNPVYLHKTVNFRSVIISKLNWKYLIQLNKFFLILGSGATNPVYLHKTVNFRSIPTSKLNREFHHGNETVRILFN